MSKSKKLEEMIDENYLKNQDENSEEDDSDDEDMEDSEDEDEDDQGSESDDDEDMIENEKEKMNEQEYQAKLIELENSIIKNKLDYQSYVDIIRLSKENTDFNKLREYRQKMSQVFPLTEALWLDWLRDENKFVESCEDRLKMNELFERAIKDYLSVDIWLEYIQFSIGGMGDENGIEKIRDICERAVSFAGLHVNKGSLLWIAYREFEMALLAGYQQSYAGSIQTSEQMKQQNEQMDRIIKIFKRQLSVCLDNMENTIEELKQFDESKINDDIKKTYESTFEKYKKIEPFETSLLRSNEDPTKKLAEYKKYIEFEINQIKTIEKMSKNSKNNIKENELLDLKKRLRCLFERAIADNSNCLDSQLWLDYIYFLNEEDQSDEGFKLYESVVERSIRNCTWSGKLWVANALLLESRKSSVEEIKAAYNQAMNAGLQTSDDYLQLWHAYLDFLRRSLLKDSSFQNGDLNINKDNQIEDLRDTFQKAINQQFDYFNHDGDPTFSLEKYWAIVEAKYLKNMEKSRKIFNEMILNKGNNSKYLSEWLEFYDLEKQYGDEKHQRKLLNRALNELSDENDKEYVLELIYKFEKLNGNVNQAKNSYLKLQQFKEFNQKRYSEMNFQKEQSNKGNSKFQSKDEKHQQKKQEKKDAVRVEKKKAETSSNLKRKSEIVVEKRDSDGFAIPTLPVSNNSTEQPVSKKQKSEVSNDSFDQNLKYSDKTVFISNLLFDVDEEKIKAIFDKQPGFKGVRLVKHWSGKNKGFGYVDFETAVQANDALKLDRTLLDGRPLFVSKNKEKNKESPLDLDNDTSKFKYATNLEKNKLFVKGLSFTTDIKKLEEIFKTFGKLKEVRIVTHKSGKSKGMAYVDFEDEQSASKALMQTDGMLVDEHQISVAISNPPKRKAPTESSVQSEEAKKSLGSGTITNRNKEMNTTSSVLSNFVPRSQLMNARKKTLNF